MHAVPQACNWQADEQPVEIWRKARPFGPCALQSYGNRVKVLVAAAVVPNELTKEMRELMVTTLNVSKVELYQKVESLRSVIGRGQLLFIKFPASTELLLEFFVHCLRGGQWIGNHMLPCEHAVEVNVITNSGNLSSLRASASDVLMERICTSTPGRDTPQIVGARNQARLDRPPLTQVRRTSFAFESTCFSVVAGFDIGIGFSDGTQPDD